MVRGRIQGQTDLEKEAQPGPPDFFGRITFVDRGGKLSWTTANAPKPLTEVFKKATASAAVLLNTLRLTTTVSIRQRAIFYGTYCLSKFTCVASYACVTQKEIYLMQVKVAKAVLRRHWIQARHYLARYVSSKSHQCKHNARSRNRLRLRRTGATRKKSRRRRRPLCLSAATEHQLRKRSSTGHRPCIPRTMDLPTLETNDIRRPTVCGKGDNCVDHWMRHTVQYWRTSNDGKGRLYA